MGVLAVLSLGRSHPGQRGEGRLRPGIQELPGAYGITPVDRKRIHVQTVRARFLREILLTSIQGSLSLS